MLREDGRFGNFHTPEFREAIEFYIGLYEQQLAPRTTNTRIANLYHELARGRFAMYITGPWNMGEFRRRLPPEQLSKWMPFPLPGPHGAGASMAGGSSLVVFRRSEHKSEAWQLIEFLSAREQQLRFHQLLGNLPARKSAWDDPALRSDEWLQAFRQQLTRVVPTPPVPEWERIAMKVMEESEAAVNHAQSLEETLDNLDRQVDQILAKRRWMLARTGSEP